MRFLVFPIVVLLSAAGLISAQTISTKPAASPAAEPMPKYRPILLGTGPTALINQIDRDGLMAKGQKDAAIMFFCIVDKSGKVLWSETYRGTANSKVLEQEVAHRLETAKFIPGVFESKPVDAVYYGTVTFAVIDGKPRLRIFSNQEAADLKQESDFIGPQPIFGNQSKFLGLHYPPNATVPVDGIVELSVHVDQNGLIVDMSVKSEEPPLLGFGKAAIEDFKDAKFIPGFRKGQPVECTITLPVHYLPKPWNIGK